MSLIWVLLYVLSFLIPLLVVIATSAFVLVQARALQSLSPRSGSPWKYVGAHLGFVIGIPFVLETLYSSGWFDVFQSAWVISSGVLDLAVFFAVPSFLYWKNTRSPQGVRNASSPALSEPHRRTARLTAWLMAVAGFLLPWLVGIGVKLLLMGMGKPTLSIRSFLAPAMLPHLVMSTLTRWSFPFLGLALFVRYRLLGREHPVLPFRMRQRLAWLIFAAGSVSAVPLFIGVFWQYDPMDLVLPFGFLLLPAMWLTYRLGWRIMLQRQRVSPSSRVP